MTDTEKLIELLRQVKYCGVNVDEYYLSDVAKHLLANDFTKVVRCKDCKYCQVIYPLKEISKEPEMVYYCNLLEYTTVPSHFCSYGELKELG